MADEGTTTTQQAQPDPKAEPTVPKSRFDERGARISQLEQELTTLRPKAQGYDAVNQQVTEWQSKAQQAEANLNFVKAFARHGFVEDEEVAHLAQAYSAQQGAIAADKRMTPHAWLERGIQDPNTLGMVTGTFVSARLSSRSGSAAASAASQPAAASTGSQPSVAAQPVTAMPAVVQAPASNAGVKQAPTPTAKLSDAEQKAIARDPKKFREWREKNPDEYAKHATRPLRSR